MIKDLADLQKAYWKNQISYNQAISIAKKLDYENKVKEQREELTKGHEMGFKLSFLFMYIGKLFKQGELMKLFVVFSLIFMVGWGLLKITGLKTLFLPSACDCANLVESMNKDRWFDDNGTYHDSDDYWKQVGAACMRKYTNMANYEIEILQSVEGVIPYKAEIAAEKECKN